MYLEGMSATMDVAMRLEEFLQGSLVLPVDPFGMLSDRAAAEAPAQRLEGFERELFARLQRLGFAVLPTARSPFDALSSRATTTLLTGAGAADSGPDRTADTVSNISRVVEQDSVMFGV